MDRHQHYKDIDNETADVVQETEDNEDNDVDEIEFNEGEQLRVLANEFRRMPKECPYFAGKGEVRISVFDSMEFECELTTMIFAKESKAGEWLERCCSAPEKCYHYRKAKEEEGQPVEQQTITTDITENAETAVSTERQDRAAQLTQRIMANGKIAASSMIEMGRDLKAVRDERLFAEMGFDSFEEYCEKKIGIGKRHGYNFIQIYEKFGEEKLGQLQQLGITKLLEIAKLDDEDAEDLMQHNDVNALSVRELSAKVDEYRNKYEQLTLQLEAEKSRNAESVALESQLEELKKQLEAAQQEKAELLEKETDKLVETAKKYDGELKKLSAQIKDLESRPAEISEDERNALIQQGRDEAKTASVRESEKKSKEIDRLKAENDMLRENADKVKESAEKKYKDELEKLRVENAALQSNAQNVPAPASGARDKVKFYLTQIQAAFTSAVEAMSDVEDEERAELAAALQKALERMREFLG